MFSLALNYTDVTFNLDTPNILMEARALTIDGVCKTAGSKYVKFEAFQDNIGKKAKEADFVFCDS